MQSTYQRQTPPLATHSEENFLVYQAANKFPHQLNMQHIKARIHISKHQAANKFPHQINMHHIKATIYTSKDQAAFILFLKLRPKVICMWQMMCQLEAMHHR